MSKIEWTNETWNPIVGCSRISEGCKNCYAIRMAWRLMHNPNREIADKYAGTVKKQNGKLDWTGKINECVLAGGDVFGWRKPRMVFVCSMGDLFHENVSFKAICRLWNAMKRCPQHIFQILTKRPARMKECVERIYKLEAMEHAMGFWSHVWLGVTAENQKCAEKRIPILLEIPAAVRFVSVEPLLSKLDLTAVKFPTGCCENVLRTEVSARAKRCGINKLNGIDWVICGGESGPGARPMELSWARDLRDQCKVVGVPYFLKQLGGHPDKRNDMSKWPDDLRIREYPEAK